MKLDAKVKGGLAWAGLIVILAVPAADIMFGKPGATSASTATATDTASVAPKPAATRPVLTLPTAKPAATDPIQTASTGEGEAVDKYVKSGKKLPSYISDADEVASAPASATTKPAAPVTAPSQVATVEQSPPVPLPRTARPKATEVASLPAEEEPLIIDETRLNDQASVQRFPLSDEGRVVTSDELEEWDSGSLADYLERKRLLSDSPEEEEYYVVDDVPVERRRLDEFFLF